MEYDKGILATRKAPDEETPYGSDADLVDVGGGNWLSITDAIAQGYVSRDERSGAMSATYRPGVRIDH